MSIIGAFLAAAICAAVNDNFAIFVCANAVVLIGGKIAETFIV